MTIPKISAVIPGFNNEQVLDELYKRLIPALEKISPLFEIVFVDDGSRDNSFLFFRRLLKKMDGIY
jgi:dolichol-phosphate mannosyltransferase